MMNSTRNFSVYKSSAGSGKTYTLVREYIALALQSPAYFRHILAITFTNKAANEMKQRIIQGLVQLSDPEKYAKGAVVRFMLPDLEKATGLSPDSIKVQANASLTKILHEYDDFSVRTIDSFVSRIIRTFAHDLHLPVDFEIEMDKDLMLDEAVDQLISKAGVDEDLTKILIDFTEAKTEDEKSWQIEADIKKTSQFLFSEGSSAYISKLHGISPLMLNKIALEIRLQKKTFGDSITLLALEAKKLITDHDIDNASFSRGNSGIGGYFFKLAEGTIEEPNSFVLTTIRDNKWLSAKADTFQVTAINLVKDKLTSIFQQCHSLIETGIGRYTLLDMIEKNIFQMGVLNAMESEIDTIRREKKVLHISEFNKRITDIILKEPVPFIYERIGEKYFNYLIDEFQDTSELQWKNLLPLIGDSLANGRYNLVVGDGKQAIYRFRNGKVEQFMILPALPGNYEKEVFGDTEQALGLNFDHKVLKSNFRSLPEIINFNNSFFSFLSQRLNPEFQGIYTDHAQEISPGKSGGLVTVEFRPYRSRDEFDQVNILRTQELIIELNSQGYANSDIAILTRSNREGSIIACHLMAQGINVVSAEALLLAASSEVNFIIAVLQHISNPRNLVAVAGILNELIRKGKLDTSLTDYFPVQKSAHLSLEKVLQDSDIEFSIKLLQSLPLYDLCEEIIRIFMLQEGTYDIYLQFFLDFVNKVSSRQGTHLADLLEAWNDKKAKLSVVVPEGIDAIRIMTIHKAKGLEFPVVIWPMATERHKTTFDQLWVDLPADVLPGLPVALLQTGKNLEEIGYAEQYEKERNSSLLDMFNLIYVAFTRPAERLYIISREPGKSDSNNLPGLISQYIDENMDDWEKTEFGFVRGTADDYRTAQTFQPERTLLSEMISTSWQGRIRVARRAPVYWSMEQTKSRQTWGTIVHDTLASVKSNADIQPAVQAQVDKYMLDKGESELLFTRVSAAMSHDLLKKYFDENVSLKPESGILTPKGDIYRPDRVVFFENETVIMEFKTGLAKPGHESQLHNYGEILTQMGYTGIRKLLIYLDETVTVKEL